MLTYYWDYKRAYYGILSTKGDTLVSGIRHKYISSTTYIPVKVESTGLVMVTDMIDVKNRSGFGAAGSLGILNTTYTPIDEDIEADSGIELYIDIEAGYYFITNKDSYKMSFFIGGIYDAPLSFGTYTTLQSFGYRVKFSALF